MFDVPLYKITGKTAGIACMLICTAVNAQSIDIDGELFRDPTQPPSVAFTNVVVDSMQSVDGIGLAQALLGSLTLNFVRSGGLTPVAVINQQSYKIGDVIESAVISDIRAGEVELTIDGVKHVVSMFTRPVRQMDEQ